ncbi:metallophosphoesterase [bacterium]|nr:metallophosphoesterase [bacterium]
MKKSILAILMSTLVSLGAQTQTQTQPLDKVGNLEPWVQLIATDTLAVTFLTGGAAKGTVLWRQGENEEWQKAAPETKDGLIRANGTIQRAYIKGFDPLKPVFIKPVSEPIKSFGAYNVSFSGAKEGKEIKIKAPMSRDGRIAIGIVCDLHNQTARLFPTLSAAGDDLSLCVLNGDICDAPGSTGDLVNNLATPMAALSKNGLLTLAVRGNHECRGAGARDIPEYMARPNDRYYGALTLGCARVVFLDTGEDKPKDHAEYSGLIDFDAYLQEEAEWLKKEVESAEWQTATWRVVFMHIPPRESEEEHSYPVVENGARIFAPCLVGKGVNIAISGHEHKESFLNEEEAKKYNLDFPVLIGGGGSSHKNSDLALRFEIAPGELYLPKFDWRKTKQQDQKQTTSSSQGNQKSNDIWSKINDIWQIIEKNRQK